MRIIKQTVVVVSAVIAMGVVIAFLLYELKNKMSYEQKSVESLIPEKRRNEEATILREEISGDIIRVLIRTDGFENEYHDKVVISSDTEMIVKYTNEERKISANEKIDISGNAIATTGNEKGKITIHSITRGDGNPTYKGSLEVFDTENGMVIVNEVTIADYLGGVIPSEMPLSYELEALKAQAVCARSYVYNQMQNLAYPEYDAHVDDSVSYQVYNNFKGQENSDRAVQETAGELLWYGDEVAKTYFYSTSSGHSTSIEAWGSTLVDGNQYLQGVDIADQNGNAYESEEKWYRWSATIESDVMEKNVEKNAKKEIGDLRSIEVTERGRGNVVQKLEIRGSEGSIVVETENKIRRMLGGTGYKITKQDGSVTDSMILLPSAFFSIEKNGKWYIISGGGYGHGIGMSQSGANELAKSGKNYREILEFFYPGTKVR